MGGDLEELQESRLSRLRLEAKFWLVLQVEDHIEEVGMNAFPVSFGSDDNVNLFCEKEMVLGGRFQLRFRTMMDTLQIPNVHRVSSFARLPSKYLGGGPKHHLHSFHELAKHKGGEWVSGQGLSGGTSFNGHLVSCRRCISTFVNDLKVCVHIDYLILLVCRFCNPNKRSLRPTLMASQNWHRGCQ